MNLTVQFAEFWPGLMSNESFFDISGYTYLETFILNKIYLYVKNYLGNWKHPFGRSTPSSKEIGQSDNMQRASKV